MTDDGVPTIAPWQRWLAALAAFAGGLAMLAIGLSELATLIGDLRTLPPVLIVTTDIAAFLPLGFAITALGLFFAFPPSAAANEQRNRRPRGVKAKPDRAQLLVVTMLVCLLLYPVLTVLMRVGTDWTLERHGYRQEIVDPGFRAKYLIVRWTRDRRDAAAQRPDT